MAKSITQWNVSAYEIIKPACSEALVPFIEAGQTNGQAAFLQGLDAGLPSDQYICERIWTTAALAQNWLDIITSIEASTGAVCLNKSVVE